MKRLNKKGLSLTELIVAMALLVIILAPISLLFYSGYSNYFVENDKMNAAQALREAVQMINEDLRSFEDATLSVVSSPNQLRLKDNAGSYEVTYLYDEAQKDITKNGISIFDDVNISVEPNLVGALPEKVFEEISDAGYDTTLIKISFTLKYGRYGEESVRTFYRRKFN